MGIQFHHYNNKKAKWLVEASYSRSSTALFDKDYLNRLNYDYIAEKNRWDSDWRNGKQVGPYPKEPQEEVAEATHSSSLISFELEYSRPINLESKTRYGIVLKSVIGLSDQIIGRINQNLLQNRNDLFNMKFFIGF